MDYSEITNKKLADYGYDSRKLSIKSAQELMLVARHIIACDIALFGRHGENVDVQSEKIASNEWLCILLQDHIDNLRLMLK